MVPSSVSSPILSARYSLWHHFYQLYNNHPNSLPVLRVTSVLWRLREEDFILKASSVYRRVSGKLCCERSPSPPKTNEHLTGQLNQNCRTKKPNEANQAATQTETGWQQRVPVSIFMNKTTCSVFHDIQNCILSEVCGQKWHYCPFN